MMMVVTLIQREGNCDRVSCNMKFRVLSKSKSDQGL